MPAPIENKTLLAWEAPVRPFKKRGREYFQTIIAIAVLLGIILIFMKEWFLIAVIIALVFVVYVMGTIPPEKTTHEITTLGVKTGDKHYHWDTLRNFWFTDKWQDKILYLQTKLRFPRVLMLLLGDKDQEEVKKLLLTYLPFEEPTKTSLDKASDWLTRKFPLEETSK